MKKSVAIQLTDILPLKRRLLNKIVKSRFLADEEPGQVFRHLKKLGFDGIELLLPTFATIDDIREAKKMLQANKIRALSVHQALRFLTKTRMPEITRLFEAAKEVSAKVIVLHMNSAGQQILNKKYLSQIHVLQKKYGIQVGFENREKYFVSARKGYGWDEKKFADLMAKENLHITLDTCHMGQAGGDIIKFFVANKDRIINIHLSDYKHHYLNNSLRPLRFKHLPLGKGTLPIMKFMETLKKEQYKGILTLEINTNLAGLLESASIVNSST